MAEQLLPHEHDQPWRRRIGWFIVGYLFLLVVCIRVFLVIKPRSTLGWIVLVVFGPPLYIALEWAGGKLAEPWGESTPLRRLAKAVCIAFGYLSLVAVWLLFGPAICPGGG
jgi:hypothetical protein